MAYPKKFRDPYTTSIQMERILHGLAQRLNIKLSEALAIGFSVMIKSMIADESPLLDDAALKEFLELEKITLAGIKAYIRFQEQAQKTLGDLAEMKAAQKKADRQIKVWDPNTEAYVFIPRSRWDSDTYQLAAGETL